MKKFIFCTLGMCAVNLHAETIHVYASKDNTLYETDAQPLSNGAGDHFFVGRTNQGTNDRRRGLLHFSLLSFPAGTTINDVSLEITANRTIAAPSTITIHTAQIAWGEGASDAPGEEGGGANAVAGDATWTDAFLNVTEWSTAGGDFDPTALASTAISGVGTISFNSMNFTTAVQDWVDNPANNHGLVVLGDESSAITAYRFATRENQLESSPRLIIDYTLPTTILQLQPAKDNTLYETVDGSTSNGAGDRIFMGNIQNGLTRRAVMEFDVSGIHAAATINSVTLDLSVTNIPGSAQNADASLHFATTEWGAAGSIGSGNGSGSEMGDATWIHSFFNTDTWNNAGGDFIALASATTSYTDVDNTINFTSNSGLIADVTTWIQDANNNHGWVLRGDEANPGNARGLGSADNPSAGLRPTLTVEYAVSDLIFADDFE